MKKSITGLLLASGQGQRFDPSGQVIKLLATLPDGRPVIRQAAEHLCAVLDQVHVVVPLETAAQFESALKDLPLHIILNTEAQLGMGRSIALGVRKTSDHSAGWIVALGDMPFIEPQTIAQLRDALLETTDAGPSIVAACFKGQRGHPVGFAAHHAAELGTLTGDQGARELLKRYRLRMIETSDSGILKDIDLPDDLNARI